jgi:uncharacterized protein (DUF1800 family)
MEQASKNTLGIGAAALLSACGGGGEVNPPAPGSSQAGAASSPPVALLISRDQASRFLAQASMGATREHIARVQELGYAGWIDEQMAMPASQTRWDAMVEGGYAVLANKNSSTGFDPVNWRKLLTSSDTLRQRITFALSEILVIGVDGIGGTWRGMTAAHYLDLLEANAFGNYRTLLQQVSTSAAMGEYLTFRGNRKYNATTGALPDENYARELMQLFTIGLLHLNLNGTATQQETYTLDDIGGLARVLTGWDYDLAGGNTDTPDYKRRPMAQVVSRHETGEKKFLGATIPAGTNGETSLTLALDTIFAHANVAPFIVRQLIQRLITSNPSPEYVERIARVFNNDGKGVKGNLKAVIRALLLDDEARNDVHIANPAFGKQREPVLRFTAWARAFKVSSTTNAWSIGNTSDGATRLGQSPLRSASVFNFFRPGYVPPNSAVGNAGMVAPEFQITNESSVVGYINYMQNAISRGVSDVRADYSALTPLADDAQALLTEINTVLAAGQLDSASFTLIRTALDTMAKGTDTARNNRIHAALTMTMASPAFIVQK